MKASDFRKGASGRLVRNLNGQWAFVPTPLPAQFRWSQNLASNLSRADRALGKLAGMGGRLRNPQAVVRGFLRREAELSSRIEQTFARVQTLVLFEHIHDIEREVPDVREVDNNYRALQHGLNNIRHRPITLSLIKEMHHILLKGVRGHDKQPGEFRSVQAHIGRTSDIRQARFVPAPPHMIQECMDELAEYIQNSDDLPPLVRAAMAHYQFEAIHPFADGNGRIGRVLILLMLCAENALPLPLLNPSAHLETYRREYYDHLLAVSQRGEWSQWIEFFADGIAAEASDAINRIERLEKLRENYQTRVRAARRSALLPRLIDELFVNPAITVNSTAEFLSIGFSSAKKLIERLLGAGIVREATGHKRNRVFLAQEIVDLFATRESRA